MNKTELLDAEILKIDSIITDLDLMGNDYNCITDHPEHIITLEYNDSYDYERIIIQPLIFNEYGIIKYTVSVESYNLDNDELQLNDYFYCKEIQISENRLNQIERKTHKENKKYLEIKPIILTAFPEKMITIENSISNRECFNNITHYHYYYSKTVTLETREFNDIEAFLQLRDFFNRYETLTDTDKIEAAKSHIKELKKSGYKTKHKTVSFMDLLREICITYKAIRLKPNSITYGYDKDLIDYWLKW